MILTPEELRKINKRQTTLRMIAGEMSNKIENGITEEEYDGEMLDITRSYERILKELQELELKKLLHLKAGGKFEE